MRHPLVMGNWKLNGSKHMTAELIDGLRKELSGVEGCGVAIAPLRSILIRLNMLSPVAILHWVLKTLM